jgi:hypothetical protein
VLTKKNSRLLLRAVAGDCRRRCCRMAGRYMVGSYATSPSGLLGTTFNEAAECAFFAGLAQNPAVAGLELALFPDGKLHPHSEDFLLEQLKQHGGAWNVVITCIPGTMGILQNGRPRFGLASDDAGGRAAAVAFVKGAAESIKRVHAALHWAAFGVDAKPEGKSCGRVVAVVSTQSTRMSRELAESLTCCAAFVRAGSRRRFTQLRRRAAMPPPARLA